MFLITVFFKNHYKLKVYIGKWKENIDFQFQPVLNRNTWIKENVYFLGGIADRYIQLQWSPILLHTEPKRKWEE